MGLPLTEQEQIQVARLLGSPFFYPPELENWIKDRMLLNAGSLNVNQLGGYAALGHPPGYVTNADFPATGADGEEVILVDSLTAPSYVWRFRYNADYVSPEKWEFIGGSPHIVSVGTLSTTNSLSYVALASAGPTLVIPRAGVYEITHGSDAALTGGTFLGFMSYDVGGVGANDNDACKFFNEAGGSSMKRQIKVFGAVTLTAKYKTSGGNYSFYNRHMSVLPIRVS